MKQKWDTSPGSVLGCYTVLAVLPSGTKTPKYRVRCECGDEHVITHHTLISRPSHCKNCCEHPEREKWRAARHSWVGQIINGWRIITEEGRDSANATQYLCECVNCGNREVSTIYKLQNLKGTRCIKCPPDYGFIIENGAAKGVLPSGDEFLVDESDIPLVNSVHWYINEGYLFNQTKEFGKRRLHRMILGLPKGDRRVVDHINRNKLDNRRSNLRIVEQGDNCRNKSLRKDNRTGFVGVHRDTGKNSFYASIGHKKRTVRIGVSENPVYCAQLYNIAAITLFRDCAGHLNDVPEPSLALVSQVVRKLEEFFHDVFDEVAYEAAFAYAA